MSGTRTGAQETDLIGRVLLRVGRRVAAQAALAAGLLDHLLQLLKRLLTELTHLLHRSAELCRELAELLQRRQFGISDFRRQVGQSVGESVGEAVGQSRGCGIGGSARILARDYGFKVVGISISPAQIERARSLTSAGLSCRFAVMDALALELPDASFDAVWSVEACPHMPDKQRYADELLRVLKPGGLLAVADWNRRDGPIGRVERWVMRQLLDTTRMQAASPREQQAVEAIFSALESVDLNAVANAAQRR